MFEQRTKRMDVQIAIISQPHVHLILLIKAGAKVEFGTKLSTSLDDGNFFLDHLDWNN